MHTELTQVLFMRFFPTNRGSVLRFLITVTHFGCMPRRGILSIAVGFNLRKREACTATWTLKGSTIWEGCVLSQRNGPSGARLAQMGSGLVDPFRVVPNWAGDRAHGLKPWLFKVRPFRASAGSRCVPRPSRSNGGRCPAGTSRYATVFTKSCTKLAHRLPQGEGARGVPSPSRQKVMERRTLSEDPGSSCLTAPPYVRTHGSFRFDRYRVEG